MTFQDFYYLLTINNVFSGFHILLEFSKPFRIFHLFRIFTVIHDLYCPFRIFHLSWIFNIFSGFSLTFHDLGHNRISLYPHLTSLGHHFHFNMTSLDFTVSSIYLIQIQLHSNLSFSFYSDSTSKMEMKLRSCCTLVLVIYSATMLAISW